MPTEAWWLSEWEQKISFLLFCSPIARFLTNYDPKNRDVEKKTHVLRICHVQNSRNVSFFRKKKPCGSNHRPKIALKSFFEDLTCPKFWKCVIFPKKKPLREHPTDKSSF